MQMKHEKTQEEKERLLNSLVEAESVIYLLVEYEFIFLCLYGNQLDEYYSLMSYLTKKYIPTL